LEKKPSTRLSQEPVLRGEGEFEAACRLIGEPGFGLFRNVRGMIVEDQLDRGVSRISGIEKLEEFNEFATAVAVLDESVNLSGEQINTGQQTDRTAALIFMIACKSRMHARLGRQVWCRGGPRLDTGLLVIGKDRHRIARLLFGRRRGFLDELHLAVDTQHFRHLGLELGIAAFQVIPDLMGLYLLLIEDLAKRALSELAKAAMPLSRSMLPRMASEKTRSPQFVRIAEVLGLAAGKIHHPCLGLGRDRRYPARPRPIIERCDRTIGQCPLDAALDGLMVHPPSLSHRKKGRVFPVGEQNSRPLNAARRLPFESEISKPTRSHPCRSAPIRSPAFIPP
jgi:hypothetical protein